MFSRQNDAGSRASNTQYWENLVLVDMVDVLVSECKGARSIRPTFPEISVQNFNGSVRSNRKSFEKTGPPFEVDHLFRSDRSEFWLNGSRPKVFVTEIRPRPHQRAMRLGLPSTLIRWVLSPKTHRFINALESGSERKRKHIVLVSTVEKRIKMKTMTKNIAGA